MQILILNSLRNDKIFDLSKFKAFGDDKIILTQKLKFVLGRVDNIVEKGENAGYQHFLLFQQCFQSFHFQTCLRSELCGKRLLLYKSLTKGTDFGLVHIFRRHFKSCTN